MTREEFYDAMNLIADDLIEEVDALRRRRRKRKQIVQALSLAACFCLVVGSAFVWGQTKRKVAYDGAKEEFIQDAGTEYPAEQEQSMELPVGSSGNSFWDSFSQVKVIVDELTEDGFVGIVSETGKFAEGTKLIVCVTQGEYVEYTVGNVLQVEYLDKGYPDEEYFSDDKVSMESTAEHTIYAEKITLIEGSELE